MIDLRVQRISRNTDCTRAKLIVLFDVTLPLQLLEGVCGGISLLLPRSQD